MSVPVVRVGDIAEQIRGVIYAKGDAVDAPTPDHIPVLRAGNISDNGLDFNGLIFVSARRVSPKQLIRSGDVVIAASSGSLDIVGKSAQAASDFPGGFGAFCKVLRPRTMVDARYFGHYFRTPSYRKEISALAAGANINNLRSDHLDGLQIPLPALEVQRRIAQTLDSVDALRTKRREAITLMDDLAQSTFIDMFGKPATNDRGWEESLTLREVADISSGITKGRNTPDSPMRSVPYMTVLNVQERRLDLATVKTIEATEVEINRYQLIENDLLLTEGGDPDKLGRGTLWRNELPECIHQNHIFRVRLHRDSGIEPIFLNWLVASERGRRYFLRSAKQTTGIASINATQLKQFPLLTPPIELQRRFVRRLAVLEQNMASHIAHLAGLDALFASLQHRAFRGELWADSPPSDASYSSHRQ